MTATYLLLAVGFILPVASIGRTIARDNTEGRDERELAAWERYVAAEGALLPVDFHDTWPQRQTPSDLPARVGMVIAEDRPGRHRAPEPEEPWNSPTGQFHALVGATWSDEERATLSREWWCESCEGDHKDCAGVCACPCTLVEVSA